MSNDENKAGVVSDFNRELGLTKVYEVIDVSDEESYWPLGIFLSFDDAKTKIDELNIPNDSISPYNESNEHEKIEIVERYLGWGEKKKILFTIERELVVDDEIDEFVWVVKT